MKTYIGLMETPFKDRYRNHVKSFNNEKYQKETELSKYIWELKDKDKEPMIKGLHGGKTTMLYLNLSGHDIFKTRFGTSPEKHCLTATPYRLFQGNLRNLHKIGT